MSRRARGCALALAAALVATTGGHAAASCPPYTGSASWLERLAATPNRMTPLSDAELMEWFDRENVPPLSVMPWTGPAPLTVEARWLYWPVADPVKIEVDLDGDGVPDATEQGYRARWRHTYARPGRYEITVWIHERGGRVRRFVVPVDVAAAQAFEADLLARWDTLKSRLGAGDLAGALDCMHSAARKAYEPQFKALFVDRRTRVDDVLTSISFVKVWFVNAEFEMLRPRDGQMLSYYVRFSIDGDGVWRLRSF